MMKMKKMVIREDRESCCFHSDVDNEGGKEIEETGRVKQIV
jgi:hypothetical protein